MLAITGLHNWHQACPRLFWSPRLSTAVLFYFCTKVNAARNPGNIAVWDEVGSYHTLLYSIKLISNTFVFILSILFANSNESEECKSGPDKISWEIKGLRNITVLEMDWIRALFAMDAKPHFRVIDYTVQDCGVLFLCIRNISVDLCFFT